MPGRRSTRRYAPLPSVTTDRVFSMRAGLAASTVTPGSTAPDESLTLPARPACANTTEGRTSTQERTAKPIANLRILCLLAMCFRDKLRLYSDRFIRSAHPLAPTILNVSLLTFYWISEADKKLR